MKLIKIAAVCSVLVLGAGVSNAATCTIADVQFSSDCIGRSSFAGGSPVASDLDLLDGGGWMFVGKEDDSESSSAFDIDLDETSGEYTLFSPIAGYDYALALKGGAGGQDGQFFAAYLLAASDVSANLVDDNLPGMFNMDAFEGLIGGGNTPELSNATLFKRGSDSPPPMIPLPAAGWMLIAGLGGIAAMKRRKRAA